MICNAGIGYHDAFDDTPTSVMRRLVDVNLMGTFYAAHAAHRACSRQQGAGTSSPSRRSSAGAASADRASTRRRRPRRSASSKRCARSSSARKLHASVVFPSARTRNSTTTIARDFGHAISGHGPDASRRTTSRAAIVECIVSPKSRGVSAAARRGGSRLLSVVAPAQADRVVQKFGRQRSRPASR